MFDAQLYRSKSEVEKWKEKDPISNYTELLKSNGIIDDNQLSEIENKVKVEVSDAIEFAENGNLEAIEDLEKYVYSV